MDKNKSKKIISDLSKINADFSSLEMGDLEDLKTDDFERARRKNGLKPKKTIPEDKKRTFEQALEIAHRNVDEQICCESSEALMYGDKTSDGRKYQVLVKVTTNQDDFQ